MVVKEVYIFRSGMVMAFDEGGKQVTEAQGFLFDVVPRLCELCDGNTEFTYMENLKSANHIDCDFRWWFEKRGSS